jgi:hypothetical protein
LVPDHSPGFEGYARAEIPGTQIVKVIQFDDAEFEALTGHSSWRRPLR